VPQNVTLPGQKMAQSALIYAKHILPIRPASCYCYLWQYVDNRQFGSM
jgi:hypothetical protein